jgi:hypothetical protein
MDILIAATPTTPPPATNAGYVTTLQGKTAQFDAKLTELETLLTQPPAGLHAFLRELDVVVTQGVPLDRFDTEPLDVEIHRQTVSRLTHTLLSRVGTLAADLDARIAAVDTALVDGQVEALQRGGAALLGDDVRLIPELTFTSGQSAELSGAYQRSDDLLRHATTVLGVSTIDHWLNGIARVRNSMYALEQAALYAQALAPRGSELGLTPIQLPFRQGESWLALEFDPAAPPTGERLLYTAHYAGGTNAASACGLLIDEWTEVIPANDETAGLTFHYDRPGSEPPQVWLLVTAPRLNGVWNWSDVLGALDETFDLIRLRAVEPQHVEATPYARFLPATTSAAALTDISISLNLARVNDYATHPGGNRHG